MYNTCIRGESGRGLGATDITVRQLQALRVRSGGAMYIACISCASKQQQVSAQTEASQGEWQRSLSGAGKEESALALIALG